MYFSAGPGRACGMLYPLVLYKSSCRICSLSSPELGSNLLPVLLTSKNSGEIRDSSFGAFWNLRFRLRRSMRPCFSFSTAPRGSVCLNLAGFSVLMGTDLCVAYRTAC